MELRVFVQTVQQQAVDKLRAEILTGVFEPGNRLVETDLCARLGVSRPSLCEALRSLGAKGLVNMIPNRAPQIPVLTWEQTEEIYQVRTLLEGEAAALCAKCGTKQHLEGMREIFQAIGKSDGKGRVNLPSYT